jgi:DNA/RNA-binding domain of Phe-tRNA-synthetase-like protein
MEDPEPLEGWVDPSVAEEFPALRLLYAELPAAPIHSPPGLRDRLRELSDGFRGPQAIMMRQQPIPHAYRVFFRHIGLDPDADRIPVEALAVERLRAGGFKSQNRLDDALTIAIMETGIGLWALDADRVEGGLGIRPASGWERLGRLDRTAPLVPDGRLVVADEAGPLAVLFGDLAPGHGVTPETARILLFALQVTGVPAIHVEEAFWTVAEVLAAD